MSEDINISQTTSVPRIHLSGKRLSILMARCHIARHRLQFLNPSKSSPTSTVKIILG